MEPELDVKNWIKEYINYISYPCKQLRMFVNGICFTSFIKKDDNVVRVWFVISNNGNLHVEGARTALYNYLFTMLLNPFLVFPSCFSIDFPTFIAYEIDIHWRGTEVKTLYMLFISLDVFG